MYCNYCTFTPHIIILKVCNALELHINVCELAIRGKMAGIVRHIQFGFSENNNCDHQCGRGQHGVQTPASKHCKLLEEIVKRQNQALAQKDRVHDEMRSLIDWLKRDLCKAEARVRQLESDKMVKQTGEENGETQEKTTETPRKPKIKSRQKDSPKKTDEEILQEQLFERNEKLTNTEDTFNSYERELEDLKRENEDYLDQIRDLKATIRQQEQELKIDREIEDEREKRLKKLVAENEEFSFKLCRLKREADKEVV